MRNTPTIPPIFIYNELRNHIGTYFSQIHKPIFREPYPQLSQNAQLYAKFP